MPTIQELVRQFQRQITNEEAVVARRLTREYLSIYERLQNEASALLHELETLKAQGIAPTRAQLYRLSSYKRYMDNVQRELARYAGIVQRETEALQYRMARLGVEHAERSVLAMLDGYPPEARGPLVALFQQTPRAAIEAMIAAMQDASPLVTKTLAKFGPDGAAAIRQALLDGLVKGRGPRETARLIRKQLGIPLSDALRISRTEALRAHRAAAMLAYRNNSRVVNGWVWFAQLGDNRTCMSCVAQHGSLHTLDETLEDHPNGRCVAMPRTLTMAELGLDLPETQIGVQRGEDWFKGLDAATQERMMGSAKWQAWREGKFAFADLSKATVDKDWGRMFTETPLRELVG